MVYGEREKKERKRNTPTGVGGIKRQKTEKFREKTILLEYG